MRKTNRSILPLIFCVVGGLAPFQKPAFAGPILPVRDGNGNVTWGGGDPTAKSTVTDQITLGDTVSFVWTMNGKPYDVYGAFTKTSAGGTGNVETFHFVLPNDANAANITDWQQTVSNGNGGSVVAGGNIQHNSPWAFHPLQDLNPPAGWQIPDLAPFSSGGTIYTAVNLQLYYASNPKGFLFGDYMAGQTLDELGIGIVNGVIPGLDGIYFATSPFVLDPLSATGWVPSGGSSTLLDSATYEASNGSIGIIAIHTGPAPEPSSVVLAVAGIAGILLRLRGVKQASQK